MREYQLEQLLDEGEYKGAEICLFNRWSTIQCTVYLINKPVVVYLHEVACYQQV